MNSACRGELLRSSEHELQGELHRPRSANLIKRIQAAVLAAASERCPQHLRRLAELRRTEIVDGASEVGVVEDIEKIRSRLKSKPLPDSELPPQRQIDVRGVKSPQGISSQISLHGGTRYSAGYRESCRIDFLSAGHVRVRDPQRCAGHQVGTRYGIRPRLEASTEGILPGD